MNADQQTALEKQIIDLPDEFWDLNKPDPPLQAFIKQAVYYGLVIAAVFQCFCLLALIFLPAHHEERYFAADTQHANKKSDDDESEAGQRAMAKAPVRGRHGQAQKKGGVSRRKNAK